jgi:hypothetical protein
VMTSAKLTSAASSRVQTLVGLPKVRGLWCNRVRSCSRRAASKVEQAAGHQVLLWARIAAQVQ